MVQLKFTKMQGLGNCFVLMENPNESMSAGRDLQSLARSVCDRNFGIGADGLVLIGDSDVADYRMRIFNEDGSEAEMCGNAIRCVARYVIEQNLTTNRNLQIETLSGVKKTHLLEIDMVEVDMGRPVLRNRDVISPVEGDIVSVTDLGREFTYVSMGNPHAVNFVNDFDFDWRSVGAKVENGSSFPNRTNVEFVKKLNDSEVEVRVWERGCGETLACGTGACAVVVAGNMKGLLPRAPVEVRLAGGRLNIHWNSAGHVMMTGPAKNICAGLYFAD